MKLADVGTCFMDSERPCDAGAGVAFIDLSSSSSDSDDADDSVSKVKRSRSLEETGIKKKPKANGADVVLPKGFLDPLPPASARSSSKALTLSGPVVPEPLLFPEPMVKANTCRQFWKAGDYEKDAIVPSETTIVSMDHVRVHPKFLHSNATSHKWALGAFAELLDNALDEVCNGATYVKADMLINKRDGSKMLLIEDDGGGMGPEILRQCMSLGYSAKSKQASTIGQYGNGFKTSTMRLGADVVVFSRCLGKDGNSRPTQSIGLLSYTFLRCTGKDDIVVPMVDYEKVKENWKPLFRSTESDWIRTLDTILEWSPYANEIDLLQQFSCLEEHGTRIVIYNLWQDDQGELELDFEADPYDIQLRGVNRDENKIEMAKHYPNSRHFLTFQHSLRSYASIIYLKLPVGFRMILRGKDVKHHNIVNDMMLKEEAVYRPVLEGVPKDSNMVAVVTMGFVKDAKHHIDIQGFNVYHKNRLIKPFWRVWHAAGSHGRGIIGVLEANFVEPAHDKQGFERTTVLSRLEARLIQMQKTYWSHNCHKIGYAPVRKKKVAKDSSPDSSPEAPSRGRSKSFSSAVNGSVGQFAFANSEKSHSKSYGKEFKRGHRLQLVLSDDEEQVHGNSNKGALNTKTVKDSISDSLNKTTDSPFGMLRAHGVLDKTGKLEKSQRTRGSGDSSQPIGDDGDPSISCSPLNMTDDVNNASQTQMGKSCAFNGKSDPTKNYTSRMTTRQRTANSQTHEFGCPNLCDPNTTFVDKSRIGSVKHPEDQNHGSTDRLVVLEENLSKAREELQYERDRIRSLEKQLEEYRKKLEEASKEQESLIDIFSEERTRRNQEEETLRNKLKEAYTTIQEMLRKQGVKPGASSATRHL